MVEFKVRASWLQPVLMAALEQEAISQEKYSEAICNLFDAGHSFTSIDTNILSFALSRGEDKFENIAKALFGESAKITSHLKVMLAFLRGIWNGNWPSLQEQKATSILLRRVFFGEWKNNMSDIAVDDIASLIIQHLNNRRFANYYVNWLKGHFLVPFDEPKSKPLRNNKKKDRKTQVELA